VASLGFLRPALGRGRRRLTLAESSARSPLFPFIKMLGDHLTLMRWVVTFVIAYAAIAMLRSARRSLPDAPVRSCPDSLCQRSASLPVPNA